VDSSLRQSGRRWPSSDHAAIFPVVMPRRKIGSLDVSVIGIGCNQFGPTADESTTARIVATALDEGMNFFDTADEYGPDGVSEEYLGRAIQGRRDDAVLATKFGHFMAGDPERGGASARWITRAVEDSLRRLGTDRIDLYQQHFPDPHVDPEETLSALDGLVRSGKILHYGVCNLPAGEVEARCRAARSAGLEGPVSAQSRYNLLRREARNELIPVLEQNQVVLIPFFPLASGMLTGKYKSGQALPPDSRFARHLDPGQAIHIVDRDGATVARLDAWAAERGHSVAELALAWLASQEVVGSVIAGVSRPEQVSANAKAARWSLDRDEVEEVAALVAR
jgi:aryl-alcohol dehydrogenase-like predicted oxidoreductase